MKKNLFINIKKLSGSIEIKIGLASLPLSHSLVVKAGALPGQSGNKSD